MIKKKLIKNRKSEKKNISSIKLRIEHSPHKYTVYKRMCHCSWPSLAQQFSCLIDVMPLSIAVTHETLTCENVQFF